MFNIFSVKYVAEVIIAIILISSFLTYFKNE